MKKICFIIILMVLTGSLAAQTQTRKQKRKARKIAAAQNVIKVQDQKKYPLIISFISIGQGTDYKTMEKLDSYLAQHPKKPQIEKVRWGREGEIDYQFELKEFSTEEQKQFREEIQKLVGTADLVKISEGQGRVKK